MTEIKVGDWVERTSNRGDVWCDEKPPGAGPFQVKETVGRFDIRLDGSSSLFDRRLFTRVSAPAAPESAPSYSGALSKEVAALEQHLRDARDALGDRLIPGEPLPAAIERLVERVRELEAGTETGSTAGEP